jgi:hypothetical protein
LPCARLAAAVAPTAQEADQGINILEKGEYRIKDTQQNPKGGHRHDEN